VYSVAAVKADSSIWPQDSGINYIHSLSFNQEDNMYPLSNIRIKLVQVEKQKDQKQEASY
jgi:hypothetical protein